GMVRFVGTAADAVRARWPEVVAAGSVTDAGRVQAWVVGPGLGTSGAALDVLAFALRSGLPVCVDADAVTMLANRPRLADERDPDTTLVLTPHDGEYARFGEPVGDDRVAAATTLAKRLRATVLLKGFTTVIAGPDGQVLVNPARGAWPATAGSGDVLSGVIGALLASGMPPMDAAGCAAFVHSLAGDLSAAGAPTGAELSAAGAPTSASRLADRLPDAIRAVRAASLTSAS
ncbi:MAG: NAD(P)H-hydrate dehydratase, partial [Sciscionella sp.]|nr:NAD(P)H-hydrate dehydratase [Sciscionella sp.]